MILLQKRAHLLLKTPLLVVRPLTVDVPQQRPHIRRTHGEQSISALPRELRDTLFFHPHRRACLQLRHHLRRGPRHRKTQRDVHMIFDATHAKTLAIQPASSPREIRMQSRRGLLAYQRHTTFRTEDNMHQIEAERLRYTRNLRHFQPPAHPTKVALQTTLFRPSIFTYSSGQQSAKGANHNSLGRRPRSVTHQRAQG